LAVIDHGKVIAEGTSRELKASIGGNALEVRLSDVEQESAARGVITGLIGDRLLASKGRGELSIKVDGPESAAGMLLALTKAQIGVVDFSLQAPSLDDVFFALTGRPSAEKSAEEAT
jgi:ABC-2 type transport system ATP-binding protein